jgi:hypothetical protein
MPDPSRIMIMTSASAGSTPQAAKIRTAGWTGRIGMYGVTPANWASTYSSYFVTNTVICGGVGPGDAQYVTDRAVVATLHGAGYEVLASTVNTTSIALALADECEYVLTDEANDLIVNDDYIFDANPVPIYVTTVGQAISVPESVTAVTVSVATADQPITVPESVTTLMTVAVAVAQEILAPESVSAFTVGSEPAASDAPFSRFIRPGRRGTLRAGLLP